MNVALGILIMILGWNIMLWNLSSPGYPYFDEVRYISAARQMVSGGTNENWAHPPLGKVLIHSGMLMIGDNPLGWRFMSSMFGALTLGIMYAWGFVLFKSRNCALATAALTFVNQVHFVQSRAALLDVYMFTFMAMAMMLFTWVWLRENFLSRRREISVYAAIGALVGLAMACKWYAVILCAVFGILIIFDGTKPVRTKILKLGAGIVALPLVIYLGVSMISIGMAHPQYAPAMTSTEYTAKDILPLQIEMIRAQTAWKNPEHPYLSSWYTWPAMIYPIWYDMKSRVVDSKEEIAGIVFLGNPLLLWTGFLAAAFCLYWGIRRRSRESLLVAIFYFSLWLSWAVIPRHVGFAYYYYPAAMILSLAVIQAARALKIPNWACVSYLLACLAVFCFYYPVLTNSFLPSEDFRQRLFLPTWK